MYVSRIDDAVIGTKEVYEMRKAYYRKFGEFFPYFNYADFQATEEKCAGQVYKETLERALQSDKPYHIVSHRYDEFDH